MKKILMKISVEIGFNHKTELWEVAEVREYFCVSREREILRTFKNSELAEKYLRDIDIICKP